MIEASTSSHDHNRDDARDTLKKHRPIPQYANGLSGTHSPPSRPNSPSTSSLKAHSHLGLRPKAADSLHSRIRSSNPVPQHVSKIEDITSLKPPKGPKSASREGSLDSSRPQSRNASEVEPMSEDERAHSRAATEAEASEDSPEGETYEIMTTDIGLYSEPIYDQYLGPVMGSIRRFLIKSLLWESPILARHQTRIRSPRLDRFFVYTSLLGSHSFFLIFLPMAFWLVNGRFARGLCNVLAAGVYLSSAIKDAFCVPRPYSPPVTRLVVGTTHLEYGFISTHSTNSCSVALYIYFWLMAAREQADASSYLHSRLFEVGLVYYIISVVYGRIYCGMHSIMDCVVGAVVGVAVTLVQWYGFDLIDSTTDNSAWYIPVMINSVGLLMVIFHPQPLDDCPCFEDAIAFLSAMMGIATGRWMATKYNLLPQNDNPLARKSNNIVQAAVEQISASLTSPKQSTTLLSTLRDIITIIASMVVGLSMMLAIRVLVKTVCKVILPPIFLFVQGYIGFILPRRHYKTFSEITSQNTEKESQPSRPQHLRTVSSASGRVSFSSTSDPKDVDQKYWKTDTRSEEQRSQDLLLSQGQLRPMKAERNKIKFTLGDGSDLPVPFTHSTSQLPGDAFSERIAGALSAEENLRQRRAAEKSFQFPTRKDEQQEFSEGREETRARKESNHTDGGTDAGVAIVVTEAPEVTDAAHHYDVDVLTKVFVYHAIGMFAACIVPISLIKLHLVV